MDGSSHNIAPGERKIAMFRRRTKITATSGETPQQRETVPMTYLSTSLETIVIVTLVLSAFVVGTRMAQGNDATPTAKAAGRLVVDYPPNPGPGQYPQPGRLHFVDARAGISIHGVVLSNTADESVASRRIGEISGSYTGSLGTGEKGGRFHATFYHNGLRGASLGDCFELRLSGGEHDGYYYAGPLDDPGAPTAD
jgi:hypothetical protein